MQSDVAKLALLTTKSPTLLLMWHFTRHVVAGVILFIVVGLAALVLKFFNDWLIALKMPRAITDVTYFLEIAIFIIDVAGLVILIVSELIILIKEIYNETASKLSPLNSSSNGVSKSD